MTNDSTPSFGWIGPYQLRAWLENCMNPDQRWPEERAGIYLVSLRSWTGEPTSDCVPMYVGTNTTNPNLFRHRVDNLVRDMVGFFGTYAGSHSGGRKLYEHCKEKRLHPLDLYIGWTEVACGSCSERTLYDKFRSSLLNGNRPARCKVHA
jgi:hypothetical protein